MSGAGFSSMEVSQQLSEETKAQKKVDIKKKNHIISLLHYSLMFDQQYLQPTWYVYLWC